MATIRLTPSILYNQAGDYYLDVTDENNALTNTDSDTYATVHNTYSSTTNRYIYLQGFNWDAVPSGAVINDFTIKLKARESNGSTSTSYRPVLCKGTSVYNNAYCDPITTTVGVKEFTFTQSFETFRDDGEEFGIRINCRRGSRNTASYHYIYGAEILVDYTIPNPATVTSILQGDGTIDPSGTVQTNEGAEYTLTITPTNKSDEVRVTNNGVDVTDQLVAHGSGDTVTITPNDVTTSGISSGSSYAQYAVGHSAESPYSSSSNMYSNSTGYADYLFDFSSIPSNATIEAVEVRCYGHRESNTIDSSHISRCTLMRDGTAISDTEDFQSTSFSTITLTPNTLPTRSQLDDVVVRHEVGYYGGLVTGISFEVTYSTSSGIDHYTYTYTVSSDATIAVVIGSQAQPKLFVKQGGSWVEVSKAYKKVGGSWVEQDITTIFNSTDNYLKGDN